MVKKRGNNKGIFIYWTDDEAEEVKTLFDASDVSKQRQSEFFMEFIIDGLKKYNKSKNPNTQTNEHDINNKQIKVNALNKIKGFIKNKPMELDKCFNHFFKSFKHDFGTERTCFVWFKRLFEDEEFVILNLDKMYIIEKYSFFHAQLKNHCFTFPHTNFSSSSQSYSALRKFIFTRLRVMFPKNEIFDKIESLMRKNFYLKLEHEEEITAELPVDKEIISLREKWKHTKALELLNEEKEFIANQQLNVESDAAEQFWENLK